jgi:uncharacterized alpha-E superfamily protein
MLLSRVADSLYWISRYLERAEHTVRLIDVAVDEELGHASAGEGGAVERLYRSLGLTGRGAHSAAWMEAALFSTANRNSVVACVMAARENARQVRDEISSGMWQQLNDLYLRTRDMRTEAGMNDQVHDVAKVVLEGIHLFQGITDGTMGHGEGWQYLQVGRSLERAESTAALLALFLADMPGERTAPEPLDQVQWVALLRSCCALEAYCRQYTADVRAERVTEFLLLNAELPRSVRFAAIQIEGALRALARHSGHPVGSRSERLAGRLRASLDYAQVDEILADSPSTYLTGISRQCGQIHAAIYQGYITYPIEQAVPA